MNDATELPLAAMRLTRERWLSPHRPLAESLPDVIAFAVAYLGVPTRQQGPLRRLVFDVVQARRRQRPAERLTPAEAIDQLLGEEGYSAQVLAQLRAPAVDGGRGGAP